MFCPKCGSMLVPKKDDNKRILACSCGFKNRDLSGARLSEKMIKGDKAVEIIDKKIETRPLTDVDCPKCGHKKAYFWTAQTRAADEAETRFFKCEKCEHNWREAH